jgi:hypothetical protein
MEAGHQISAELTLLLCAFAISGVLAPPLDIGLSQITQGFPFPSFQGAIFVVEHL